MSLGNTYGVVFIGLVSSSVMYGLTLLQTFHYYRHYPKDPARLKWMVGVLTLADSIHLMLSTWAMYWYLIANFGDFLNLLVPHWSINLQTDFNAFVSAGVQLFFTRRVYLLSENKYLLVILLVLTTVSFSMGVYFSVRSFHYYSFADYAPLAWVPSVAVVSATIADIIIAISMCYFLKRARTGVGRSDTLITTLMMYSINTGLLTSIVAVIAVILFATMPKTLISTSLIWMLGKLYVNSLLAMLNSRENLRQLAYPTNRTSSFQLSDVHNGSQGVSGASTGVTVAYIYPDEVPPQPQQLDLVVAVDAERTKDTFPSFNHTVSSSSSTSKEMCNLSSSTPCGSETPDTLKTLGDASLDRLHD
ncbi:hypothetical protein BD410DRAFT_832697 [Rickenella mellea]|uniref:DUF6534 domain-containing protein n=1 Tax=Rickenella mellea TaxID=50990 RepID=A0A4Y7PKD8_9AGAM|nr:hypothetical protein BD410DRAFT_832697 [Rickenella mellea]